MVHVRLERRGLPCEPPEWVAGFFRLPRWVIRQDFFFGQEVIEIPDQNYQAIHARMLRLRYAAMR